MRNAGAVAVTLLLRGALRGAPGPEAGPPIPVPSAAIASSSPVASPRAPAALPPASEDEPSPSPLALAREGAAGLEAGATDTPSSKRPARPEGTVARPPFGRVPQTGSVPAKKSAYDDM